MSRPNPHSVNTDHPFRGVCKGLKEASLAEQSIRCFCLAAKHYDRWDLTLRDLDNFEAAHNFHWNTTISNGFFYEHNGWYRPTDFLLKRLHRVGLIDSNLEETPKLKLFSVRVVYENKDSRKSYFTMLDTDAAAAHDTALDRTAKFKNLRSQRGLVIKVDVHEVIGPFEAGQILHEER